MKENKLVQEALIQMKQVEEAIAENAKGILQSTMKEEISQLVKESLNEQDDEIDLDTDVETDDVDADVDNDEMDMDVDIDMDDDNSDMDMDMDMDMDSEESPIDLTDASDEEILKVFKAMGEEDGIIVKKDGENIHLTDNDTDSEYLVKLGESKDNSKNKKMKIKEEMDMDFEFDDSEESQDDDMTTDEVIDAIFNKKGHSLDETDDEFEVDDEEEIMYEIEFDEQDEMDEQEEMDEQDEMDEEEEMDEESDLDEQDEMDEQEEMDDLDESYNPRRTVREAKSTVKPKGVGIGSGPKFTYKSKAAGGFKEDKKEGPKTMGTGKAKFEYKKGANMEGKSKVVKAETKEGWGSKKDEFKRKKVDGVEKKVGTKDGHFKDYEKEETKEAARTYGMGSKEGRGLRKGITNNRNYVYGNNGVKVESINQDEVRMLREKNEEYRKALNVFREKLNEVAIFNSNLAYATRLFTEHSTTKKEKINILRRFDNVESLKESKNLYKSIKDELGKVETKSINESVGTKINKTVSTGSSTTLIESKTYENPQFLRMKDLMGKLG
jgi:hypothetical protein